MEKKADWAAEQPSTPIGAATPVVAATAPVAFHREALLASATGLLALVVYVFTLAPTVTGEDSGELIAAAYTLGVPHPPGYPVWTLIAHAFTWLPLGTIAWRVNLSSAVFAAATVSLMVPLMRMLGAGRLAAVAGALTLAFSYEFWEQALIAEVYALNAFFFALLILLLLIWRALRQDTLLIVFTLVYGLSLANHNTMHLCAPFFAVFVIAVERPGWRRLGFYLLLACIALAVALLLYLFLLIRAQTNPPVNWGNPSTLTNWWRHIAREQYAFMFSQYPRSLDRFGVQLWEMLKLWYAQFPHMWSLLGVLGWGMFALRQRWTALWLVATGLFITLAFIFVQNPNPHLEWLWVMSVFGIPLYLITAIGIGLTIDSFAVEKRTFARVALWGLLLVGMLTAGSHGSELSKRNYYWVEDYGRNILTSLAPDAIYLAEADHAAFSALYLQVAEGLRPDVTLGRKYGYVDTTLTPGLAERFGPFPPRREEPQIFAQLLRETDRPVYVPRPLPIDYPGLRFLPHGLVYRAARPGEKVEAADAWQQYTWRNEDNLRLPGKWWGTDYTYNLILYEREYEEARQAFMRGDRDRARRFLELAVFYYGFDYVPFYNAGTLCAQYGDYAEAGMYFRQALREDPSGAEARASLERLGTRAGTLPE